MLLARKTICKTIYCYSSARILDLHTPPIKGHVFGKLKSCHVITSPQTLLRLPLVLTFPPAFQCQHPTPSHWAFVHLLLTCLNLVSLAYHILSTTEATSTLARIS